MSLTISKDPKVILYTKNLYKIYTNVCKMLYERGYEKVEIMEFELFKTLGKNELTIRTKTREDYKIQKGKINVYFPEDETVGIKPIKAYKNEIIEDNIDRAIIIIKDKITPFAKSEIQAKSANPEENKIIEFFYESELIFNKIEHSLVPKHEQLSPEEKDMVLKEYKIKEVQLPKILIDDPISKYYGLLLNDVVKITRPSETSGMYTNYRLIIK